MWILKYWNVMASNRPCKILINSESLMKENFPEVWWDHSVFEYTFRFSHGDAFYYSRCWYRGRLSRERGWINNETKKLSLQSLKKITKFNKFLLRAQSASHEWTSGLFDTKFWPPGCNLILSTTTPQKLALLHSQLNRRPLTFYFSKTYLLKALRSNFVPLFCKSSSHPKLHEYFWARNFCF